jgi:hypothetical protein
MNGDTTNIWFKNPSILLNKNQINQMWPREYMSKTEKINAITRLVIILTILGFLITQSYNFFITGFITLGIITALYYARDFKQTDISNIDKLNTNKEGFTNPVVYEALKSNFTNPTTKNPLMNVLLTDINDDPTRKRAAPAYNKAVEEKINTNTKEFIMSNFDNDKELKNKLFATLGDNFEFEDFGQYNFYATANTRIPNDQKGFMDFCYGDMTSGKEGNDFDLIKNNPRIGSINGQ